MDFVRDLDINDHSTLLHLRYGYRLFFHTNKCCPNLENLNLVEWIKVDKYGGQFELILTNEGKHAADLLIGAGLNHRFSLSWVNK